MNQNVGNPPNDGRALPPIVASGELPTSPPKVVPPIYVLQTPTKEGVLSLDMEQDRLNYIKDTYFPRVWGHNCAVFLQEVTITKPSVFSTDLWTIKRKIQEGQYSKGSQFFREMRKLFREATAVESAQYRNGVKTLLKFANEELRTYKRKFKAGGADAAAGKEEEVQEAEELMDDTSP